MNPNLEFLMSPVYGDGALHPLHRADLEASRITDEMRRQQGIRSVPPNMIAQLLGFNMQDVTSAMLIPFADPAGGWMDHVRMKIFPTLTREKGRGSQKKTEQIKYLQPRESGVRVYFPRATMRAVLESPETLWICEGEKKSIRFAQQFNVPTIGLCGVEGWHTAGSPDLLPDFDRIPLEGRTVKVIPDGDVETNENVHRAVWRFGAALEQRGARPELVHLPNLLETTST